VLSRDVVSRHPTPDIGSRCPWTPKHLSNTSVLTHLYSMLDLHHRLLSKIAYLRRARHRYLYSVVVFARLKAVRSPVADEQTQSAGDHKHRSFRRRTGVRVQHAKPVTTRLPKLDIGGELARLVSLGGYRES